MVYLALLLVFYFVAVLAAACVDRLRLARILIIGVVCGGLFLMLASVLVMPFSMFRYQGVFNNQNSMGWFTAGLIHLILGSLYENRLQYSAYGKAVLTIGLISGASFYWGAILAPLLHRWSPL